MIFTLESFPSYITAPASGTWTADIDYTNVVIYLDHVNWTGLWTLYVSIEKVPTLVDWQYRTFFAGYAFGINIGLVFKDTKIGWLLARDTDSGSFIGDILLYAEPLFQTSTEIDITDTTNKIENDLKKKNDEVETGYGGIVDTIVSSITKGYDEVKETISNIKDSIVSALVSAIKPIVDSISSVLTFIRDSFIKAVSFIGDQVKWIYDHVKDFVSDVVNTIVDTFNTIKKTILDFIKERLKEVADIISSAFGTLIKVIVDSWTLFPTALWNAFVQAFFEMEE
jgi:predicted PurR-regulated permease PerM